MNHITVTLSSAVFRLLQKMAVVCKYVTQFKCTGRFDVERFIFCRRGKHILKAKTVFHYLVINSRLMAMVNIYHWNFSIRQCRFIIKNDNLMICSLLIV